MGGVLQGSVLGLFCFVFVCFVVVFVYSYRTGTEMATIKSATTAAVKTTATATVATITTAAVGAWAAAR